MWIGAREIGACLIGAVDRSYGSELGRSGAVDRYRPRGRVDSDLGIEMGYGCRELYQRERERERERASSKKMRTKNGFRERERERALSEKKK